MKCPNCGSEWNDGTRFCGECGAKLPRRSFGSTMKALLISFLFIGIMLGTQSCSIASYTTMTMSGNSALLAATENYQNASTELSEAKMLAIKTGDESSKEAVAAAEAKLADAERIYNAAYESTVSSVTESTLAHTSLLLLIGDLMAILVIFLVFRFKRRSPLTELNFRLCNPARFATFALLGVGIYLTLNVILSIIPFSQSLTDSYNTSVGILYNNADSVAIQIISTALVTPIVEEIVFRAVPMKYLKPAAGKWGAVILSSLLFGLAHYSFTVGSLIQVGYAFMLGIIFALLDEKYGSVIPSIIAHMAFNLMSFVPFDGSAGTFAAVCVLGLILLAFAGYRTFVRYPTFSDVLFDIERITPVNEKEKAIFDRIGEIRSSKEPLSRDEVDEIADAWEKNRADYKANSKKSINDDSSEE